MAYSELTTTEISSGKANKASLWTKLRNNFINHETRVLALETIVINVPTASILPYAGAVAPSGYLLCDGSAVSQATYSDLYALLSTTYNTGGESAGTFRVPDLRGRAPFGKDNMGGSAASRVTTAVSGIDGVTLGASGGSQSHTLVTGEIPSHSHTQDSHTHTTPAHTHNIATTTSSGGASFEVIMTDPVGSSTTTYQTESGGSGTSGGTVATNQNTGGGGAHNNMPPALVTNFIIKT